eukprot:s2308_g1.t1
MRNFPQDKEVMIPCLDAASVLILFNRENGLLAGQLGGLTFAFTELIVCNLTNFTWTFYSQNMDDPNVTSLGGAIGAFFDYVDENRAIARELGMIQGIIQNIRNNFHGQYSDWAFGPVKNSLFALSSGSWNNQDSRNAVDVVAEEGFIPLDVALILEHGADEKIAEESLQVIKALAFYSDNLRHKVSDAGMFKALAQVLVSRSFDRGAVCLVCQTLTFLVGPATEVSPYPDKTRQIPFDADIQARAGKDGMVEVLLSRAMSTEEMQHFEHGGFNFNVDAAYPAQQQCYQALQSMAKDFTKPSTIANRRSCNFAPRTLASRVRQAEGAFSSEEVEARRRRLGECFRLPAQAIKEAFFEAYQWHAALPSEIRKSVVAGTDERGAASSEDEHQASAAHRAEISATFSYLNFVRWLCGLPKVSFSASKQSACTVISEALLPRALETMKVQRRASVTSPPEIAPKAKPRAKKMRPGSVVPASPPVQLAQALADIAHQDAVSVLQGEGSLVSAVEQSLAAFRCSTGSQVADDVEFPHALQRFKVLWDLEAAEANMQSPSVAPRESSDAKAPPRKLRQQESRAKKSQMEA